EPIQATLVSVDAAARKAAEALVATDKVQAGVRDATAVMQQSINESLIRLQEVSKASTAAFTAYQDRFSQTDNALGQTIDKLVNGTVSLGDAAANAIGGM